MTWTKLTDTFITDPDIISLPVPSRYLVVEALIYSNTHLTDGRITAASLDHLTRHPEREVAAAQLVTAGLWDQHPDGGWQIVRFLDDQRTAEQVRNDRAKGAERQSKWRETQRLHGLGDHSRCSSTCRARNAVTNASSNGPPAQSSPVLTRKGSGSGQGAGALAPLEALDADAQEAFTTTPERFQFAVARLIDECTAQGIEYVDNCAPSGYEDRFAELIAYPHDRVSLSIGWSDRPWHEAASDERSSPQHHVNALLQHDDGGGLPETMLEGTRREMTKLATILEGTVEADGLSTTIHSIQRVDLLPMKVAQLLAVAQSLALVIDGEVTT